MNHHSTAEFSTPLASDAPKRPWQAPVLEEVELVEVTEGNTGMGGDNSSFS